MVVKTADLTVAVRVISFMRLHMFYKVCTIHSLIRAVAAYFGFMSSIVPLEISVPLQIQNITGSV